MFEVRVTGHPTMEGFDHTINAIKLFRQVSGLGLKDCKDAVESMFGIGWEETDKNIKRFYYYSPSRRRTNIVRRPYIIPCSTRIEAELTRIEFNHVGFSTEVQRRG